MSGTFQTFYSQVGNICVCISRAGWPIEAEQTRRDDQILSILSQGIDAEIQQCLVRQAVSSQGAMQSSAASAACTADVLYAKPPTAGGYSNHCLSVKTSTLQLSYLFQAHGLRYDAAWNVNSKSISVANTRMAQRKGYLHNRSVADNRTPQKTR